MKQENKLTVYRFTVVYRFPIYAKRK